MVLIKLVWIPGKSLYDKGMDLGYGFSYRGYGFQAKASIMLYKGMDLGYGFLSGGMDFNGNCIPTGLPGGPSRRAFLDHPRTPSRLAEHSGMGHPSFKNVETGYGSGMDFVVTKSR